MNKQSVTRHRALLAPMIAAVGITAGFAIAAPVVAHYDGESARLAVVLVVLISLFVAVILAAHRRIGSPGSLWDRLCTVPVQRSRRVRAGSLSATAME